MVRIHTSKLPARPVRSSVNHDQVCMSTLIGSLGVCSAAAQMRCSSCSSVQPASTIAANFRGNSSKNTRKCPILYSLSLPASYIIHLHPGVNRILNFILSPGTQVKQPKNNSVFFSNSPARPVYKPAHKNGRKAWYFIREFGSLGAQRPGESYPQVIHNLMWITQGSFGVLIIKYCFVHLI